MTNKSAIAREDWIASDPPIWIGANQHRRAAWDAAIAWVQGELRLLASSHKAYDQWADGTIRESERTEGRVLREAANALTEEYQ